MDPVAVAFEAAAHCAQEWLQAVAHLPVEQRSEPGLKRRRAPSGAGRAPRQRIGQVPLGHLRERPCQPRRFSSYSSRLALNKPLN
jgi:hypothetical protein